MAEMKIAIDSASQPVMTLAAQPTGAFFTFNLPDVTGVVAANNYLSLFNPIGSGKTIVIYRATITPWTTAASNTFVSMQALRVTAASGGSLQTPNKFMSSQAASIAEVRTSNPTVTTTGNTIFSAAPPLSAGAQGATAQLVTEIPSGATFVLAPGEGIVAQTSSGNTGQKWNFSLTWLEF